MKSLMRALAVTALLAVPAAAQESPVLELVRSDFRTQKVAIVTAAMQLDTTQSSAFWPVYRQYEAELTTMWDQRLAYRTPMPGLYLCGACTHPGGSVIAINGRNAAMEILGRQETGNRK